MMYCHQCGSKVGELDIFCSDCGVKLIKNDPPNQEIEADDQTVDLSLQYEQNNNDSINIEQTEVVANSNLNANHSTNTFQEGINKKKFDWKIGLIIGLALVILGGGLFALKDKLPFMNTSEESEESLPAALTDQQSDEDQVTADEGSEHEYTKALELVEVHEVDSSQFPQITIKLSNADHELFKNYVNVLSIKEQSIEQSEPKIAYNQSQEVEITYITSENLHKNPGAIDKRDGVLTLNDRLLNFTYEVMEPTELFVRDISYNTDQYPAISMYFSLYDQHEQAVDTLQLTDQVLQVTENGKLQVINDVSKMSDEDNILSINLVVDDSGSMSDKIDIVKSEVLQFIDQVPVGKQFRLGFMSFAGASEIYQYEFTDTPDQIRPIVNGLMAQGTCTALYSAIDAAIYNIAYNDESGSKYIIVFTDGEENCSNDDYDNQAFMTPQTVINNANQFGVPVYAVGIDYDNDLKDIALGTNGDYISIGSDYEQLGRFYESIFNKKKSQYVLSYQSDIGNKQPRQVGLALQNEKYITNAETTVEPRLIDNYDVAKVMENYQINWSRVMSSGDFSYLYPYVVEDLSSNNSVFKIVYDQVVDLNAAKNNGIESHYSAPIYKVTDAAKQSDTWYKITLDKYFKRSMYKYGELMNERFRKTTYTYNLVKRDDTWLVKSIDEDDNSNICFTDETYSIQKVCE